MDFLLSRLPMNWATDQGRSSASILGLVVLSIVPFCLYKLLQDFSKTFLKRPKGFLPAEPFWQFNRATADVPLVELVKGSDYEEVLARGSKLVCHQKLLVHN